MCDSLDPIWTLKTHSLFLLTIESRELFLSEGLVCDLMDFDAVGAHEKLGVVVVPPNVIYEASGKRLEFKLQPPNEKVKEVPGHLAIRCRKATEYDIEFMKNYYTEEKGERIFLTDVKNVMGGGIIHTLVTKNSKKEREGPDAGQKKVIRCGERRFCYIYDRNTSLTTASFHFRTSFVVVQVLIQNVKKRQSG